MSKAILGLRTTIYKVADLQAAKAWYIKFFEVEPYFDEPYYIGFNIGGYELGLQPDESTLGDNVVTYWGVADINVQFERVVAAGATPHEEPQNVGGDIWVATVKDPWGNVIGLICNPSFAVAE